MSLHSRVRSIARAALVIGCALHSVARAAKQDSLAIEREAPVAVAQTGAEVLVVVGMEGGALLQRVALRDRILAFDNAPRGDLVAVMTSPGTLTFSNWRDHELERCMPFGRVEEEARGYGIDELHFAPDGERVLVGVHDGNAKLVDRRGVTLATLNGVRDAMWSSALRWDGRGERLAYAVAGGVAVADGQSLAPLYTERGAPLGVHLPARVLCFDFHPTAPQLATGHADGRIRVTDLRG